MYLPANAMRALLDLGVGDQIIAAGRVNERRRYLNAKGSELFAIDEDLFWRGAAPCIGVRRTDLHRALRHGVVGSMVRLGTTVAALRTDSSAHVIFSDGTGDRYDLVVGADGVHSSIRELLFGPAPPRPASLASASWRCVLPNIMAVDCWTVWTGPRAIFLAVPIDREHLYVFAALTRNPVGPEQPTEQEIVDAFRTFDAPVRHSVAQFWSHQDQLFFSPILQVDQRPIGRGRAVLIGDAAHAMAPTMAQGAAMAFEDAVVLAHLIAAGTPTLELVDAFERRRRRRVEWVRTHTEQQAWMLNLPYALRNQFVRLGGRQLWQRSYSLLREAI